MYSFKNLSLFILSIHPISIIASTQIKPLIAITQITSHQSLDNVRNGILSGLKKQGFDENKIKLAYSNAQGNFASAIQIAQKFVSDKATVIVGISTPSSQAISKQIRGTSIPLVFASITDPIDAKLVSSLTKPNQNTTGTRNLRPLPQLLNLIKQHFPNIKKIGIPINYSEQNSVKMLKIAQSSASKLNISIIPIPISKTTEIKTAIFSALQTDAVLALQDNTIASAFSSLICATNQMKIPVFALFAEATDLGALLSLAIDEFVIGEKTGIIISKILKGIPTYAIPVETPSEATLTINHKTAKLLNIKIPEQLQSETNIH